MSCQQKEINIFPKKSYKIIHDKPFVEEKLPEN